MVTLNDFNSYHKGEDENYENRTPGNKIVKINKYRILNFIGSMCNGDKESMGNMGYESITT